MFNSKEFAWANVEIALFGRVLIGARGVEYTAKKDKEPVHGRGENPHSIQSGNKTYEGNLMLLQSEVEAIQRQLRDDQDLTDLDGFSVTVAYVPKTGANIVTHILKGVEFTEDPRNMKQGDKFQEITLPIIFLGREVV
ncbi:hypothetical protein BFP77_08340 [Maribacter sp. 4U21]|uniref:hypothetical protein n=1 Tax=Maribacter sp. 4U21 TaxID=1889779 RepID=UPI000C15D262|nr:hypothetical protein [Maribacter sp. 4U21]PIB28916.1 hypothetical protein BFP77_08340 [Maribacter sp. 4U21]